MKKTSILFVASLVATPAFAQGTDDCTTPTALNANGNYAFDTTVATTSGFDGTGTCGAGADTINQDLFWQFTVPAAGDYTFDTAGSTFDTKLAIHSGTGCAAVCAGYNDDTGGLQSRVDIVGAAAGDMFLVQVGGFGANSGVGTLNIDLTPLPVDCSTLMEDGLEGADDCTTTVAVTDGTYTDLAVFDIDIDFYSVTVPAGSTLQVDALFAQSDGDMDLYLWDPLIACDSSVVGEGAGTGALDVGFSVSDNETVTYTAGAADENLIIEVRLWSNAASTCQEYDLVVSGSGVGGPGPIGTNYCMANNNITGVPGAMSAFGLTSISANDITVTASDLPLNQFGIFVVSDTQGFVPFAGGTSNGNICLGGVIGRYQSAGQILSSGAGGTYSLAINVNAVPQGGGTLAVASGVSLNFQSWYREPVMMGSNFTDGLEIVLSN